MNSRRFTARDLLCFRPKDSTTAVRPETAVLRDFNPAYDRLGSDSISATGPLLRRKQT
jgi:hypothetical protein